MANARTLETSHPQVYTSLTEHRGVCHALHTAKSNSQILNPGACVFAICCLFMKHSLITAHSPCSPCIMVHTRLIPPHKTVEKVVRLVVRLNTVL